MRPTASVQWAGSSAVRVLVDGVSLQIDAEAGTENLEPPDGGILTHAHQDHWGSLSDCLQRWPGKPWWASPLTARYLAQRKGFTLAAAEDFFLRGAHVRLLPAGHLPGAIGVHITGPRGSTVLVTGDWCPRLVCTTTGAEFAASGALDLLVLSTADYDREPRDDLGRCIEEAEADGVEHVFVESEFLGLGLHALQALKGTWDRGRCWNLDVVACPLASARIAPLEPEARGYSNPAVLERALPSRALIIMAGSLSHRTGTARLWWSRASVRKRLLRPVGHGPHPREAEDNCRVFNYTPHAVCSELRALIDTLRPDAFYTYPPAPVLRENPTAEPLGEKH